MGYHRYRLNQAEQITAGWNTQTTLQRSRLVLGWVTTDRLNQAEQITAGWNTQSTLQRARLVPGWVTINRPLLAVTFTENVSEHCPTVRLLALELKITELKLQPCDLHICIGRF